MTYSWAGKYFWKNHISLSMVSCERGQCWDKTASSLSHVEKPRFIVDQRSVRDHFMKLEKSHKCKMAAEERASGISPEHTELDEALQDIMERSEGAKGEEMEEKNAEKEKETAENVRKRSMERLSQTRERESPESAKKKKKSYPRGRLAVELGPGQFNSEGARNYVS